MENKFTFLPAKSKIYYNSSSYLYFQEIKCKNFENLLGLKHKKDKWEISRIHVTNSAPFSLSIVRIYLYFKEIECKNSGKLLGLKHKKDKWQISRIHVTSSAPFSLSIVRMLNQIGLSAFGFREYRLLKRKTKGGLGAPK